jgi:hypothetical protein
VLIVTSVQLSTLRISRETSTVHKAGYSVEQNNTQLNLAILSISSDRDRVYEATCTHPNYHDNLDLSASVSLNHPSFYYLGYLLNYLIK